MACLFALGLLAGGDSSAGGYRYQGRTVSSVLDGLQDASLQFLYSSDLVPDTLRVTVEPRTRDRLGVAREILAAHGLRINAVRATLYIVVRERDQRSQRLQGRVVDARSGEALAGVRVELVPLGRVAWSGASGNFAFEGLARGEEYRLRASIEDYGHAESPVTLDLTDAGDGNTIRLERVALDTVVIEASRYELAVDPAPGAQRLAGVDLASHPDVADDPIRALRRLPGITQGGLSAASHLRGGETNEVLVLFDGFPLRQVFHLPGYQSPFSLLDEDLIGSIDVFTGGFPARYGNRLAGVFDIEPADAAAVPRHAVGLSFFNAHARTGGVSDDGESGWRAAARFGTLRPVLHYLQVDTGRPSYGDLSLGATQRISDSLALRGNFLWAADEYSVKDDDERAEIASRTRYTWLRADFTPRADLSGSLWLGNTNIASDRVGDIDKPEYATGAVDDHRDASLWDLRGSVNWQWHDRGRLNAGIEWSRSRADYRYDGSVEFAPQLAELFDLAPGFTWAARLAPQRTTFALFASQRWQWSERLIPEIGLRLQGASGAGRNERSVDPRLGIRWEVGPRTGLRAHWGRFHQADDVHELAVADGALELPRAQRSEHLILGLEHRLTNGVQLRIEAFRKQNDRTRPRFENLLSPIEVFAELAPDRVRIAPDDAEVRGIELSIALERETWRAWSAISVARAVDNFAGGEIPRSWDQRVAWSSGIDWRRGQWRIGAGTTMRSGWPITPVGLDADGDTVLGARNSDRLPAFATLDLRVEYRRPLAIGSLSVALEVSNLTNRRNQCCVDVEVEDFDSEEAQIETEKQYWPRLLPSLSIEWEH